MNYLLDVELYNIYNYVHKLRRLIVFIENTTKYSNLTNGSLEGIIKSNSLKGYLLVIEIMIIYVIELL